MDILRTDRQKGKTTSLIKLASKDRLYIVCANRQRAELINEKAIQMGLDIPFPITVGEISSTKGIKSPFINKVLVDDLEDVMRYFIGKDIQVATTSSPLVIL